MPVDHHLGDGAVGQQPLERAVPEDVVSNVAGDLIAIGPREPRLLLELDDDLRTDARPDFGAVGHVGQLRTELADQPEVDAVLDLDKRIANADPGGAGAVAVGKPLVELHRYLLLRANRRPVVLACCSGVEAAAACAVSASLM